MKNAVSYIVLVFLVLQNHKSYSSHIIGGEIYYECLGYANNGLDTTKRNYLITIKLYRDCYGSSVPFDTVLGFTIYRQVGNSYINTKTGSGINSEYRIPFTIPIQYIDPPQYPCVTAPKNVCGETGTYEMVVELPIISENYVIVWQRCCRNFSLTNIKDPGNSGATFTIEIHPEAQRSCNSSPRFKNFPPTVLCVNSTFKFDHSAIDKEGDQLIYEFCESLKGGDNSNNNSGCKGGNPSPDCPPPYKAVDYNFPYTDKSPIGGSLPITINSFDGIIQGIPNVIGQFVVSVCVYEYRQGVLLSVLKRDFQFNVAICDGYIEARLGEKEVSPKHYEFNLCGHDSYKFNNSSIDSNYFHDIMWICENGGLMDTMHGWSPTIKFKEGGLHSGKFIINPYSNCGDTGYFKINVIPDLKIKYTTDYDTCNPGPVQFFDQSSSSYSKIQKWAWNFGNGITSKIQNPVIQYNWPSNYNIYFEIEDNYGCKFRRTNNFQWFPVADVTLFRPNVSEGCVPLKVEFRNNSFSVATTLNYNFFWKFSDGKIDTGYNVTHEFTNKGVYDLNYVAVSPIGCKSEANFKDLITVYDPPTANWSMDTNSININNPVLYLKDQSEGTIGRTWIIDSTQYFFDPELQVVLNDQGYHHIRMIAADRFLCTDTLDADIFVYQNQNFKLFMPNAFTPNGDGKNDEFGPVGHFHSLEKYELTIYDRWGEKIFSTDDPKQGWNGKFENGGQDLPSDTYIYKLYYKVINTNHFQEQKMLALIR